MEDRPQYVTHDDVVGVREGRIPSQIYTSWRRRAKCAQCRQVIMEVERLQFVVPGLPYPSYMHSDEATCLANIERKKTQHGARKSAGIIKAKPQYQSKPIHWVITQDELHQSSDGELIPDQRQPRRAVGCRLCGKTIEPSEERFLFKIHDPGTHWTMKTGFLHATSVEKESLEVAS